MIAVDQNLVEHDVVYAHRTVFFFFKEHTTVDGIVVAGRRSVRDLKGAVRIECIVRINFCVGAVLRLRTEVDEIDDQIVLREEQQRFAPLRGQAEVDAVIARNRHGRVVQDEIGIRIDLRALRERKLLGFCNIVAQAEAGEIKCRAAGIIQFDPVD